MKPEHEALIDQSCTMLGSLDSLDYPCSAWKRMVQLLAAALREVWGERDRLVGDVANERRVANDANEAAAKAEREREVLREACVTDETWEGDKDKTWICEICKTVWGGDKWPGEHRDDCPAARAKEGS